MKYYYFLNNKIKMNGFENDIEENKKDVDDDGNPLTIQAA
jgi:hypothetical protein